MQELLKVIRERQSSRSSFDMKRPVAREDLERILEAGRWAPTAHNMQNFEIVVVDEPRLLEAIGRIRNPVSPEFIRENYRQLSFSAEELQTRGAGILATRFPPAWRKPELTPDELKATAGSYPPSPAMLVMTYDLSRRAPASEGDFLGIISLGCVTENMWLMAEALGIQFHILSSLGGGAAEKELKGILGIPEYLRVVYAIRLGYPVPAPERDLRVRRPVNDFTHHNRFGDKGWK